MATGACGINCDVCQLNRAGICSTCGPGNSPEAEAKLEAQQRLLGAPCAILACAQLNSIQYCMRDCREYPCENFRSGPYPFSNSYLDMQERRRKEPPPAKTPTGEAVWIPEEYWEELARKDPKEICRNTLSVQDSKGRFRLPFLTRTLMVDPFQRAVFEAEEKRVQDPFIDLLLLVYLLRATYAGLSGEKVGVRDLKEGHFFQGIHALRTELLEERFGREPDAFARAAAVLGGQPVDLADAAFRFMPLPKVPLYLLLWIGDDEFKARASVLVDRSIESHFSADAIWGLVNRVIQELVLAV